MMAVDILEALWSDCGKRERARMRHDQKVE